MLTEHDVPGCI